MLIVTIAKIGVYIAFVLAYGWLASCHAKAAKVPVECYVAFAASYALLAVCLAVELALGAHG
jgi:hypothetical protein